MADQAAGSSAAAFGETAALRSGRLTRDAMLALQRSAGNAAVLRLLREEAPGAAAPAAGAPATLLVDDETAPADGQMRKGEFLEGLQTALCDAANGAFAPTPFRAEAYRWIEHWIGHYRERDAAATERAVRRFAPEAASATTAQAYVAPLAGALKTRMAMWVLTGELGDLPPEAAAGPAPPQPAADAAVARTAAELGPGEPLDGAVRTRMSAEVGGDLEGVRVHADTASAQAAARVGARAFTVGRHVAFGAGEYEPGTPLGDALIAHELTHVLQQDPTAGYAAESALEAEADAVAAGAVGGRRARGSILRTGLQLQRCGHPKPPTPDAFVTELLTKARAGDKPGFFADLRGLAGARAGDSMVRYYLNALRREGALTEGDAFRAVALQELGAEASWSTEIKNFANGVDGGQFSVGSGLAPAGADPLRQFCLEQAGSAAEGGLSASGAHVANAGDVKRDYRIRFDARWGAARFAGFTTGIDPRLSSKGPRSERAREIFNEIYNAEVSVRTMYDANTGGVREFCDLYAGPESANIIASPRLQELRALFNGAPIVATGTADPLYTGFVATVLPKAQPLDAAERQEVQRSRRWRTAIEGKVQGATAAVTMALFEDLRDTIVRAQPAGPGPGPGPAPPPPVAPLTPTAAQKSFLSGITITPPAGPITANTATQPLTFTINSAIPNPGLAASRRITIEPAGKVISGQEDETPWPAGDTSLPHTAEVSADAGAAGHTDFTARLTMVPLVAGAFAEKTATVRVNDHRLAWFMANVATVLEYSQANQYLLWSPGAVLSYHGGQLPLTIKAGLPAANPGITMFVKATLLKNGALEQAFGPTRFGGGQQTLLGTRIVLAGPAPPAVPDVMELKLEFWPTAAMVGAPVHTLLTPFNIDPQPGAVPGGADAALLASDNTTLNEPRTTVGSLREFLSTRPAGSIEQRILAAIESGAIKVKACVVRTDSAAYLAGPPVRGNPRTQVAYACGQLDDAHTLVDVPNAIGWHWPNYNDHVFLNLTPNPQAPAAKRAPAAIAPFLVHEGIHAADQPQSNTWERYQKEFRAYWTQGRGTGMSEEYDPAVRSSIGPRSDRANHIFMFLYNSATYAWVKPDYDGNVNGFRDRVDAYLWPDMVNPLLSGNLADLRREIESYTGVGYAAKKVAVTAKHAACHATEQQAVAGNRVWRDLVETKFTGTVSLGLFSGSEKESDQIKRILGIPL